jgi:hypothetical protein
VVATSEKTRQGLKQAMKLIDYIQDHRVATSEKTRQGLKQRNFGNNRHHDNVATSEKTRQGLKQ